MKCNQVLLIMYIYSEIIISNNQCIQLHNDFSFIVLAIGQFHFELYPVLLVTKVLFVLFFVKDKMNRLFAGDNFNSLIANSLSIPSKTVEK